MLKIGIVSGSVRQGRNGEGVTDWIYNFAMDRNDEVEYEIVDLVNYAPVGSSCFERKS